MSDIAIRVENLGKLYRVGQFVGYQTLRESLVNAISAPARHFRHAVAGSSRDSPNPNFEHIWALKDVSLEIKQGEVVGIIGRNGAGKTTLLKILCRITEPTEGHAEIHGRVGSLLEVGTGFHPELTGRENIYLNGAVLGMKRKEIGHKFGEIVEFSGVEKFIDTPLKRYSSGMQVRLAFSVAAHLEPEVLLVDEVLAVGDAAFQKKCLGKMEEVGKGGRTVLFVSHNMGAVNRLCSRAILLQEGRVADQGVAEVVTRKYLESVLPHTSGGEFRINERPGLAFQILGVAVTDEGGKPVSSFGMRQQAYVRVDFLVREKVHGSIIAISVVRDGTIIFNTFDTDSTPAQFEYRDAGYYRALVPLPVGLLPPGIYTITASTGIVPIGGLDVHYDIVSFEVTSSGDLTNMSHSRPAMVMARITWEIAKLSSA